MSSTDSMSDLLHPESLTDTEIETRFEKMLASGDPLFTQTHHPSLYSHPDFHD